MIWSRLLGPETDQKRDDLVQVSEADSVRDDLVPTVKSRGWPEEGWSGPEHLVKNIEYYVEYYTDREI